MRLHRQALGLAGGAVGCLQASVPAFRNDVACGMKVPAVDEKKIAAEDVLLPFLSARCRDSSECILDVCFTRLMASSLMRVCSSGPASPFIDITRGSIYDSVCLNVSRYGSSFFGLITNTLNARSNHNSHQL